MLRPTAFIYILVCKDDVIEKKSISAFLVKGATKLYFTHYSYVVIILFSTGLYKSAFSTDSFGN